MKPINDIRFKDNYSITETGRVWSNLTKRYIYPSLDGYGNMKYVLKTKDGKYKTVMAHRAVAITFLPDIGQGLISRDVSNIKRMEIEHIDGDNTNNHYYNLCWTTHQQIIVKAGKKQKSKIPQRTTEIQLLIAQSKMKQATYLDGENLLSFQSIKELCNSIPNMNRRKFNRLINRKSNLVKITS